VGGVGGWGFLSGIIGYDKNSEQVPVYEQIHQEHRQNTAESPESK